ncbi:aldo/keto reductase [Mesorhizobium sp. CAU 1741]|uniref:aldo/keto reductase n=1 Tax=Mesorhizobium sp. CAU 1741 TaxID=3140366 RepID=UPI00325B279B
MTVLPHAAFETTRIGVGCAHLTQGISCRYDNRIIHAALDAGARHFDVAPQYGLGTAEALLGRALRGRRNQVTIVSKVGIPRPEVPRAMLQVRAVAAPLRWLIRQSGLLPPRRAATRDFSLSNVRASVRDSLRDLQTDHLDALLLHMVTLDEISDELLDHLDRLRQAGTVGAIGLATTRAETARILGAFPRVFDVAQHGWSVFDPVPVMDDGNALLVTHGALRGAFHSLSARIRRDSGLREQLSEATGDDLGDRRLLAALMVGAAVAANPHGIVLVASRFPQRLCANIAAAQDDRIVLGGRRLAAALLEERAIGTPRP